MKKLGLVPILILTCHAVFDQWTTSGTNIYNSNTGNVGIGIASPIDKVHINNVGGGIIRLSNEQSSYLTSQTVTTGTIRSIGIQWNNNYTATNANETSAIKFNYLADANGKIQNAAIRLFTQDNGSGATQERMTIVGNQIGMGVSAPESALDLYSPSNATLKIRNESYTDGYTELKLETRRFDGGNQAGLIANKSGADMQGIPSETFGIYSRWRPMVFAVGNGSGNTYEYMRISQFGNVGIGTTNPDAKLAVNGTIHTKEVKVDMNNWSDCVFNKDYQLRSLAEVQQYIDENHHLPDVPSEKEVLANGQNLGEMNAILLKKIEELTLYLIEQQKTLTEFREQVGRMESENAELRNSIAEIKSTKP